MSIPALAGVLVLLVVGYLVYRLIRYGGFRGFAFGAKILAKVGEVPAASSAYGATRVRVYALDGGPRKAVGLELSSGAGESVFYGAISMAQSEQLIGLLQAAVKPGGASGVVE